MYNTLTGLLVQLDRFASSSNRVLHWGSPVPVFGNISTSAIATLGLNPSNREFVDGSGIELIGSARRFQTLTSLGLRRWQEANESHFLRITDSYENYFSRNPFDAWFRRIDSILSGLGASFYHSENLFNKPRRSACHLDLIPYATTCKWSELSRSEKSSLIQNSENELGRLLRESSIRLLVLNGQTVVELFQVAAGVEFTRVAMPQWTLPRSKGAGIRGYSYNGTVNQVHGIDLGREIHVVGYNHNIQSSFGVTREIVSSIGEWVTCSGERIGL